MLDLGGLVLWGVISMLACIVPHILRQRLDDRNGGGGAGCADDSAGGRVSEGAFPRLFFSGSLGFAVFIKFLLRYYANFIWDVCRLYVGCVFG